MLDVIHYYKDGSRFKRLQPHSVFCFGSNSAGRHGKAAALDAKIYFGAVQGIGEGLQNQSYAIPTKDHNLTPLSIEAIGRAVERFLDFARSTPYTNYVITPIGTGLSRNSHEDIAQLFTELPFNCAVTQSWVLFIPHHSSTDVTSLV